MGPGRRELHGRPQGLGAPCGYLALREAERGGADGVVPRVAVSTSPISAAPPPPPFCLFQTRDTWAYFIQKVISGTIDDPPPALAPAPAPAPAPASAPVAASPQHVEVVVPPGMPPGGADLTLQLTDGRVLRVI